MARSLSHPFRLDANGAAVTVDQATDAANAEALAVLVLTRPGERPVFAGFGLADPAFSGFRLEDLTAAVELWGPDVAVRTVDLAYDGPTTQAATVTFD